MFFDNLRVMAGEISVLIIKFVTKQLNYSL